MSDWSGDPIDVQDPAFWQPFTTLAEWARSRGATTLADVLALQADLSALPDDIAAAWRQLAATPIAAPSETNSDPGDVQDPRFWQPFNTLAEWARSRGATTLADVLALTDTLPDIPDEIAEAWQQLATTPIASVPQPPTREERLEDIAATYATAFGRAGITVYQLQERPRRVFTARVLALPADATDPSQARPQPTLEELGQEYGVTRERIRQIEKGAKEDLRSRLAQDRDVAAMVDVVSKVLGVAIPLDSLNKVPEIADAVVHTGDAYLDRLRAIGLRTIIWLAEFKMARDGWAFLDGHAPDSLRKELSKLATERGSLDVDEAREELVRQGVVPLATDRLLQDGLPGLRRFDDTYFPRGNSTIDKAELLLDSLCRPVALDEIRRLLGHSAAPRGLRIRLNQDKRFMRTGQRRSSNPTYILRRWRLEELRLLAVERGGLEVDEAREELVALGVAPATGESLLQHNPPGLKRFGDTFLPWGLVTPSCRGAIRSQTKPSRF